MTPHEADPRSDETLMAALQGGEEDAFAVLFHRYQASLTSTLQRGLRSREEARDLVQNTFVQVFRARLDYDPARSFRPWVYRWTTRARPCSLPQARYVLSA